MGIKRSGDTGAVRFRVSSSVKWATCTIPSSPEEMTFSCRSCELFEVVLDKKSL